MSEQESTQIQAAIIGSGPSGFYAAEALLNRIPNVKVDMFDRLPTPFGLVRGGVAPDHPKIKQVVSVYERIAANPGFGFIGHVEVGKDVTVSDLRDCYHCVVIACGAPANCRLGIPGEDLRGCHTATEFVGWYNGNPDYRERRFDLSAKTAIVIGQGNVAADIARVLARPATDWRSTDMSEHAIEVLTRSQIKEIYLVGRRGPAQAKFTTPELRELGAISGCSATVNSDDMEPNPATVEELFNPRSDEANRNMSLFSSFARHPEPTAQRRIHFRFFQAPIRINDDGCGCVKSLTLTKTWLSGEPFRQVALPTQEHTEISCGLVFASIGCRGVPLRGLEFDSRRGTIPNENGRYVECGKAIRGLYVTGWIKRGPVGLIGTNRSDSLETVNCILEDLPNIRGIQKLGFRKLSQRLQACGIRTVSYAEWRIIDRAERKQGQGKGKPREKFTRVADMFNLLKEHATDQFALSDVGQTGTADLTAHNLS